MRVYIIYTQYIYRVYILNLIQISIVDLLIKEEKVTLVLRESLYS